MGNREEQVDLKKSVDALNNVINTEEEKEEEKTVSLLAKAMKKLGITSNEVDLTKSQTTEQPPVVENDDSEGLDGEEEVSELEPPSLEDAENGAVDASDFIEKSLEYMGGVHDLVKSLKSELVSLRKEGVDLKKSIGDSNYALGALLNSQTSLHKSMKETTLEVAPVREVASPSAALTLNKSADEEVNTDLNKTVKDCFDDGEINILAKALGESKITGEEYQEAKRTFTLPKRLLS